MEPNFHFREIVVIEIGKTLMSSYSYRILTKLIGCVYLAGHRLSRIFRDI